MKTIAFSSNHILNNQNANLRYDFPNEIEFKDQEIGLASILGKSCGGCYTQLPPQTVIEIKENNSIITCPSCSVLQYWDGAEE